MSMWTRQEVLDAHSSMNGHPIPDAVVIDESGSAALDVAWAAFALSVVALSLALYVYLTRSH
jgi:hypothetical protein